MATNKDRIRVLLVEDSPSDAQLFCELLQDYAPQRFVMERAQRLDEAIRRVAARTFDVVFLDLTLPDSTGLDTCARMRRAAPRVPIIVLTGVDDEAMALQALRTGVEDYLVKGQVQGGAVGRAARYAIEHKQAEEALRELNATLESRVAERTAELEHRTRQLQRLTLELSRAEERERKRLAEVLHDDLQQILAASTFHLHILRSRLKDNPGLQDIAERVGQLLKEAIDKSRGLSHELSPVMLYRNELGTTFEWLAQQVEAKHGLRVHVEIRGRVESPSEGHKAFLFRTAQEILFNIVKHAGVREARLRLQRRRDRLWLTISDRGQGFDPKSLDKAAGVGLLSIRERVELLGGRMRIRSARGRGSTFLVTIPDAGMPVATPVAGAVWGGPTGTAPREHAPHVGARALRVLLVDDHQPVREGLATLLQGQEDIEIVGQAGDGQEAVDLALRLEPDVVVMDVTLPGIAGDEATRQIKRRQPRTRIVALSMRDEARISEMMRQAGAEAYLVKTATSEQLLTAIRGPQASLARDGG
ncbi:MAG: response regulator [Planctomycetes bacterium]|jgi:DNA-binding NarL/FixJ family response regulator|nr:response regulator [Planctomycetota bacterium]